MTQQALAFDAPGVGWTWRAKNPLCLRPKSCQNGAWLGPWEPIEDSWHRAIEPVNGCHCRGGQSQPTRPREGLKT